MDMIYVDSTDVFQLALARIARKKNLYPGFLFVEGRGRRAAPGKCP